MKLISDDIELAIGRGTSANPQVTCASHRGCCKGTGRTLVTYAPLKNLLAREGCELACNMLALNIPNAASTNELVRSL